MVKSVVTTNKKIRCGTSASGSILHADYRAMDGDSNHNELVITPRTSPSSTNTTDVSTNTSHPMFDQHIMTTTSSGMFSTENYTTDHDHPWGALLSGLLSSNTTSTSFQDTFEYTTTAEDEEQRGTHLDLNAYLLGNELGESIMCTFLIKDWQWIDIEARKYAARSLWYDKSSDGYQDERFDGYLISSGSTTESRFDGFVMMLVCAGFFPVDYVLSESSGALHVVHRHQGRWGEVNPTLVEEIWGARVHSNEYESLLSDYELHECLALFSRVSSGTLDRVFWALSELQQGILDRLSHLRTWTHFCPVTFVVCEPLKTCLTKSGNFNLTACYMHNHSLRTSMVITGEFALLHIQARRVNNNQPIRYSSNDNCNNCQRQIATTVQADSRIWHIKWEGSHHLRAGPKDIPCANNNATVDANSDSENGEQILPNHGEHIAYEYPPNDISTKICVSMYSSTHEHNTHTSTIKYSIISIANINDEEIMFSILGCIVLNTSLVVIIHNICVHNDEPSGIILVRNIIHHTSTV